MIVLKEKRNSELILLLTRLWYRSVKATHLFLTESDLINLVDFVKEGIENIDTLVVEYDNDIPVGFMGIDNGKLEMLFLDVPYMKKGYGRKLIEQGINEFNVGWVDVNEQNPNAWEFYKAMGFKEYDRKEVDDQGNNFPIIKMRLSAQK